MLAFIKMVLTLSFFIVLITSVSFYIALIRVESRRKGGILWKDIANGLFELVKGWGYERVKSIEM